MSIDIDEIANAFFPNELTHDRYACEATKGGTVRFDLFAKENPRNAFFSNLTPAEARTLAKSLVDAAEAVESQ